MSSIATLAHTSPRFRKAIRALARFVNPLVLLISGRGWMPIVGIIHHRGRRTGRLYSTPLGMRRLGGGVVIPRTFGAEAGWYRNLVAAGSVSATYRGRTSIVGAPEHRELSEVARAFPRYERALFRLIGIDDFVILSPVTLATAQRGIGYQACTM